MFRTCFIYPYQGFALANYAYKDLGKRKAAFIYDVGAAYSAGILQYFEAEFTRLGGKVVAKEGYQANDTEFRAQIVPIPTAAPSAWRSNTTSASRSRTCCRISPFRCGRTRTRRSRRAS